MRIQPAPLTTKLLDKENMTTPWLTWFRNVSKNLEDSCVIYSSNGFAYNLQGNLMTINYVGTGGDFELPYSVSVDSFLTYYMQNELGIWISYLMDIPKGTQKLSIPQGNVRIKDFLLVDQKNR